jgi:hypothetical protein
MALWAALPGAACFKHRVCEPKWQVPFPPD